MRRRENDGQRGVTAVVVVVCLSMVIGFLAFAINVGHMMTVRAELHSAADAAALAGADALLRNAEASTGRVTATGLSQANTTAGTIATANRTDVGITVSGSTIEVGMWTASAAGKWDGTFVETADLSAINAGGNVHPAVRVTTRRAGGDALPVFMNRILGAGETQNMIARATAVVAPRCGLDCPLVPVAIFSCADLQCGHSSSPGTSPGPITVQFGASPEDNGAWTAFLQTANDPNVERYIRRAGCTGSNAPIAQGTPITLNNGDILAALKVLQNYYDPLGTPGTYKNEVVTVPVIDCLTLNPNQTQPVKEFKTIVIDRVCTGTGQDPAPCSAFTHGQDKKLMQFHVVCQGLEDLGGNCTSTGAMLPRLVIEPPLAAGT
jgi:hypothetical protein